MPKKETDQKHLVTLETQREETDSAVTATYVMLGELDFDGLGVCSNRLLLAEQALSVREPGQQLVQRMLELPQG